MIDSKYVLNDENLNEVSGGKNNLQYFELKFEYVENKTGQKKWEYLRIQATCITEAYTIAIDLAIKWCTQHNATFNEIEPEY